MSEQRFVQVLLAVGAIGLLAAGLLTVGWPILGYVAAHAVVIGALLVFIRRELAIEDPSDDAHEDRVAATDTPTPS